MLQDLFNGVLEAQFGVCFIFRPRFWTFTTPKNVQFPKWESLGSIPCTLPHLWKFISHLNTLSLPHGPLHSTLNREPNVRVVTSSTLITHVLYMILMANKRECQVIFPPLRSKNHSKGRLKLFRVWIALKSSNIESLNLAYKSH
jgi:hypothetical protein